MKSFLSLRSQWADMETDADVTGRLQPAAPLSNKGPTKQEQPYAHLQGQRFPQISLPAPIAGPQAVGDAPSHELPPGPVLQATTFSDCFSGSRISPPRLSLPQLLPCLLCKFKLLWSTPCSTILFLTHNSDCKFVNQEVFLKV